VVKDSFEFRAISDVPDDPHRHTGDRGFGPGSDVDVGERPLPLGGWWLTHQIELTCRLYPVQLVTDGSLVAPIDAELHLRGLSPSFISFVELRNVHAASLVLLAGLNLLLKSLLAGSDLWGGSDGGKYSNHHPAMRGTPLRPIDQLTNEWSFIARSPEAREIVRSLAVREPDIAATGADNLAELVSMLRGAIGNPRAAWAPRVLQALLRANPQHPLVSRAILQALLPGLTAVARRLSWGSGGEWTDGGSFFVDLIATAWEVIEEWAGEDRPYAAPDLLSAIRCRMRRQIMSHRRAIEAAMGSELDQYDRRAWASGDGSDLDLLARAIDDLTGTEISRTDAAILYGSRVLGLSMTELANLSGRSRRYLTTRRRQAERVVSQ
jgi:hypothetical protein